MNGKKSLCNTKQEGSFQFNIQRHYSILDVDVKYQLDSCGFSESFSFDEFVIFLNDVLKRQNDFCNDDGDFYSVCRFVGAVYFSVHLKELEKRKLARCLIHSLSIFMRSVKNLLLTDGELISNDYEIQQSALKSIMILFNATDFNPVNTLIYIDNIIPYLEHVLGNCITKLGETDNRSVITSVLSTIHLCIQIALAILQKYRLYCNEYLRLCVLHRHLLYLQQYSKLTLDTAFNCALLLMLIIFLQDEITHCIEFYENTNKNDPMAILSVSNAFLTVVPLSDIPDEETKRSLIYNLLMNVFNFYERFPNDSHIVLGLCKVMRSISPYISPNLHLIPGTMLSKFVLCVWLYLDHFTDVVKYLSKEIMIVLINNKDDRILLQIMNLIKGDVRMDYCKSVALCCLSNRIPISELISANESFIGNMISMLDEGSNFIYVRELYKTLMRKHLEQINSELWFDLWIYPVIEKLKNDDDASQILEDILLIAVKLEPSIITHIIASFLDEDDSKYKIVIKCLAVLRRHTNLSPIKELKFNFESEELWKGCLPLEVIERGISNSDPEISITTAGLIVHSCKSTECYTATEIRLLKIFISLNTSNKSESVRQRFLILIKSMLIRLNENIGAITKKLQSVSNNDENLEELLKIYENYISWIIEYCVNNLFVGSSFARKYTVLSFIVILHDLKLMPYTTKILDMLLYCLTDSYEVNKKLALKLLIDSECVLKDNTRSRSLFQTAISLCLSIRSPHNSSSAYILELLCSYKCSPIDLRPVYPEDSVIHKYVIESIQRNDAYLETLDLLIRMLKDRLRNLDNSLFKKPVYGILHSMRHLIKCVSVQQISANENWKSFVEDLIPTCLQCNELALKIVGSPHPEGYTLDEDSDDIDEWDYEEDNDFDGDNKNHGHTYAQFTLVCSWRTIKEASLMLGDLSQICFNLHRNDAMTEIIDKSFMLLIGEKLRSLLVTVIHRGAFEQIYIAFSQLCFYLWRFPDDHIRNTPEIWLFDILSKIRDHDDHFCSLRRSAGLPFIIQALLCTEKSTKKSRSSYLGNVIEILFDICTSAESSQRSKVHALNILRTLFKNAQLGEEVLIHVEKAIIIAMDGIRSSDWPEKNSSTLLLSSVITRVFGVSRSRNKIAWKNKMTSQMFFRSYPSLFEFFINRLKTGLNSPLTFQSSLYTTLLILSRLYPSSCENNEQSEPSLFIPHIYQCSGSPILKIRELTSVAISSFITPVIFVDHLETICRHLKMNLNENSVHGLLLQMEYMLRNVPFSIGKGERLHAVMTDTLDCLVPFLSSTLHSYIVKETFVKCAQQILNLSDRYDLIDYVKCQLTFCHDDLLSLLLSSRFIKSVNFTTTDISIGRRAYERVLTIFIFYLDFYINSEYNLSRCIKMIFDNSNIEHDENINVNENNDVNENNENYNENIRKNNENENIENNNKNENNIENKNENENIENKNEHENNNKNQCSENKNENESIENNNENENIESNNENENLENIQSNNGNEKIENNENEKVKNNDETKNKENENNNINSNKKRDNANNNNKNEFSTIVCIAIDILFYVKTRDKSFVNCNVITTFADCCLQAKQINVLKLVRNVLSEDYLNSLRRKNVNDYLFILKYLLISDDRFDQVSTVLDIFEECEITDVVSLIILYLDKYVERDSDDMKCDLIRILNRALQPSLQRHSDKIVPFILHHFDKFNIACYNCSLLLALKLWTYAVKQSLSYNFSCLRFFAEDNRISCSLTTRLAERFSRTKYIDAVIRATVLVSWILINVGKLYDTDVKKCIFVSEGVLLEDELMLSKICKSELRYLLSEHPALMTMQLESEVLSWFEETCSISLSSDKQCNTLSDIVTAVKVKNATEGDYFSFMIVNYEVAKVVAIEKLKLISDL